MAVRPTCGGSNSLDALGVGIVSTVRKVQAEYIDAGLDQGLEDLVTGACWSDGRNYFRSSHKQPTESAQSHGSTSALVMDIASASARASLSDASAYVRLPTARQGTAVACCSTRRKAARK